jgi:hypothetical protein
MEDRDDSPQASLLEEHRHIFQCPGCGGELQWDDARIHLPRLQSHLRNRGRHPDALLVQRLGRIPLHVTDTVKAFYEETPFPNYDDFDSVASLQRKASEAFPTPSPSTTSLREPDSSSPPSREMRPSAWPWRSEHSSGEVAKADSSSSSETGPADPARRLPVGSAQLGEREPSSEPARRPWSTAS